MTTPNVEPDERATTLRQTYRRLAERGTTVYDFLPKVLIAAFGLLSFLGTYIGFRDIISLGDQRGWWVSDVMVFFLVALSTIAMVYVLNRFASNLASLRALVYFVLYLGLAFFSVSFGFAFYWGLFEARQQSIDQAMVHLQSFQRQAARIDNSVTATLQDLEQLRTDFQDLALLERSQGNTCGEESSSGDGPRTRHRDRRASEISTYVNQLRPNLDRIIPLQIALNESIEAVRNIPGQDDQAVNPEQVEALFEDARRSASALADGAGAFVHDVAIVDAATVFAAWSDEYADRTLVRGDDPNGTPYRCYSVDASIRLDAVSRRLDNLQDIDVPELTLWTGAVATREAVSRMFASVFGTSASLDVIAGNPTLPPEIEARLREQSRSIADEAAAEAAEEGLRQQDLFPLSVALIVDVMLFLFTFIDKPPAQQFNKFRRIMRGSLEDDFNPLQIAELRTLLTPDPTWELLSRLRFDIDDEVCFLAPAEIESFRGNDVVRDILHMWEISKVVTLDRYPREDIATALQRTGKTETFQEFAAANGEAPKTTQPKVNVYVMSKNAYQQMLLRQLIEDGGTGRPGG